MHMSDFFKAHSIRQAALNGSEISFQLLIGNLNLTVFPTAWEETSCAFLVLS